MIFFYIFVEKIKKGVTLLNAGFLKEDRIERFKELIALCDKYKHVNQYAWRLTIKDNVMLCKWYRTYIKSIRRDIVIILIIDLLYLFIMEVWLRCIPAPYPIFVKIGDLFVTLGISFIASFIFYLVQVHLPRIKEKEDLFPYIASMF